MSVLLPRSPPLNSFSRTSLECCLAVIDVPRLRQCILLAAREKMAVRTRVTKVGLVPSDNVLRIFLNDTSIEFLVKDFLGMLLGFFRGV